MSWTREAIYEALKTKLQTISSATVKNVSRRQYDFASQTPPDLPAIWIKEYSESITQEKGSPALRTFTAWLIVYADSGNEADLVKGTLINNVHDAIDTALKPDPITHYQTLGGRVSHCWTEGSVPIEVGAYGEYSLSAIPVNMLVNQDNDGSAQQFSFDSGYLFAVPIRKLGGTAQADLTPIRIGNLKKITIDADFAIEYARGQMRFPINAASSQAHITGRAETGVMNGLMWDKMVFGLTPQTGSVLATIDQAKTIPASPYTVTPTTTGGTFTQDLGVVLASDGSAFTRVTGVPTTGQYSEAAGVYTFAAADTTKAVAISYIYTLATGNKLTLDNGYMGLAPSFKVVLQGEYNGKKCTWILNQCVTKRFSFPTVLENFTIQDFAFEAISDASGNLGIISLG